MWPDFVDQAQQRQLIEQVGGLERDSIQQVLDAPDVRGAQAPHHPDDFIALFRAAPREGDPS